MRAEGGDLSRAALRAAPGVLLVLRDVPPPPAPSPGQPPAVAGNPAEGPEVLLAVWDDGSVTGFAGHVDLGTGLRTALTQIVAEELDLSPDQVRMVMGSTASAPNQGATIASASIQIHALPLRQAAAQARAWLRANALDGRHVELMLDPLVAIKPMADYRLVGQSTPRVDIPAKVHGELVFVHDMRVPGMLHGRVVRPPYAGLDAGEFVGNTLEAVDEASIAHIAGIVAVVVQRDFVGVVAEREDQAEAAMAALTVRWKPWPGMAGVDRTEQALRANSSTRRLLLEQGQVDQAIAGADQHMLRTYVWPYQMHASIGPSCALADWHGEQAEGPVATVWAGTQSPHVLRADLALLTGVPDARIDLVRMEAAGCYGRNGADDVAADALLLARAVGKPVRVQLTRAQENAWEPKGAAQLMQVDGGLNADGSPAAYDFQTSYPSNGAPTLALLLTRTVEPVSKAFEMGDRTAVPPYAYEHLRVAANDMAPMLRASWLRGVSALPNSFAHESYIDELATAAGVDPVAYRLQYLKDARAAELVRATADKAGWQAHTAPQQQPAEGDILKGQGFAYARYIHSKFPGFGAAWAAWVADVEVNQRTGEVHVSRIVVGHDAGLMVNPAGVQHQVHGNVLQTTSRALKERVEVEPTTGITLNREWGSYPILSFREVPVVEVMLMPRPGEAPLGAGESASVPGTAAIANAIFDATGVRFREPPFTPEVVRAGLGLLPLPSGERAGVRGGGGGYGDGAANAAHPHPNRLPEGEGARWPRRRKPVWATALAFVLGGVATVAGLAGWRSEIAPVARPAAATYSAATIERGRLLAAAGDCVVCHTAPGGLANTGGRAMDTPFGTVYTTNLTPDPDTGLGRWSLAAFQRAMREGISRDGRHLYPAFPYTAFTKMTEEDLTAVYAYLMAQPAVAHQPPVTQLPFPFGLRPLLAGWNALYLDQGPVATEPTQTPEWNRGAYLVNSVGHCSACHTPRNALGAERGGSAFLSGAVIDGWEAPALTALSKAPVPWTQQAFYDYLRHGHSREHGAANGPMAPVVQELAALPDADIQAMATYLASLNPARAPQPVTAAAALPSPTQRLFENACGACHHDGDGPKLLGLNLPLALSTKLHSDRPDNLLRVLLEGVREAAGPEVGFMPAFADNLSDAQIAELAGYLRSRYAPSRPAWQGLQQRAAALRATPTHAAH
ncbi:molybdopterin cofactor-binding domain-containing protein [Pseudorhodoferax sp. Leaf267]|uniref:molybdopterin cofactor-binding domain-containing protein n=1 Tax=Pseudorhodoferax sp. Leaf267 TaxID=1736316 RepID=UPI0006F7E551|nr:molybdopterin cofactor-binding domain-containing protein [Pseudorhodoferax sp. Leaf267]KQP23133.1 aldehyde dehydrogenase [Pseudorhodoferax sp. Leaf267]